MAWSEEDDCYIGSCPSLFYGGCHGDHEREVFADLCDLGEEIVAPYASENRPLPPATAGRYSADKRIDLA